MSTIRGVKDRRFNFVQLLNSMLEDKQISLKAKGFIGYCLTKTKDWTFHVPHLCSVLKEGDKAIYSVINECIENGYGYRFQPRDDKGRALAVEFIISDSKYEIETIKKEIESLDSFKKFLPVSCFGKPVKEEEPVPHLPHAENRKPVLPGEKTEAIYSNTEFSNTEEQQQMKNPPAKAVDQSVGDSVAVSSKSKEQEKKTSDNISYVIYFVSSATLAGILGLTARVA